MFRTLMTTTAIVALLTAGAMAQDAAPAASDTPATTTEAPAAPLDSSILASGYSVTDKDNLATEIIGKQVYSSTATDAEHIGDVNNLVVGERGEVAAVVIGVGGFLGIGEKNVAVNYSELQLGHRRRRHEALRAEHHQGGAGDCAELRDHRDSGRPGCRCGRHGPRRPAGGHDGAG